MNILTIRTDTSEAEIGLYQDTTRRRYDTWQAHRTLAETIHRRIVDLLGLESLSLADIQAVVAYQGPGSFTGLRIGLSVANALAEGLNVPIVAAGGKRWVEDGCARLLKDENDGMVMPLYGAPVHITTPKS